MPILLHLVEMTKTFLCKDRKKWKGEKKHKFTRYWQKKIKIKIKISVLTEKLKIPSASAPINPAITINSFFSGGLY